MIKKAFTILSLYFVPSWVLAQFDATGGAEPFFNSVGIFINERLIPVMILLALVYVIYSGVSFIASAGEQAKREEKKKQILWGIIGLFVIMSIWGLVALVGRSFNLFAGGVLQ